MVVKIFVTLEIQIGFFQIGVSAIDGGLHGGQVIFGCFLPGFTGRGVGFGGGDCGFLRGYIGRGLNVFNPGEELPFAHVVAFLDQDGREFPLSVGTDIDVIARLDFARGSDQTGKILLGGMAALDRDDSFLTIFDAGDDAAGNHQKYDDPDDDFPLCFHLGT